MSWSSTGPTAALGASPSRTLTRSLGLLLATATSPSCSATQGRVGPSTLLAQCLLGSPCQQVPLQDPAATVAHALASMVPCTRLYLFLGQTLAAGHRDRPPATESYLAWVQSYSSAEFAASL